MVDSVRAVLFDLDGTLLDHLRSSRAALSAWLPAHGVPAEDVGRLAPIWVACEERHYPAWRSGQITFHEQRMRRLRDFLPHAGLPVVEAQLSLLFTEYLAEYERSWVAFDDAGDAVRRMVAAGCRVGVLTNGDLDQQTAKVAAIGLSDLCGPVFASSSLSAPKPDRRSYLEACAGLGAEPAQTVMIGDNYDLDVLGARAAGLRAIHLDRAGIESRRDPARIPSLRCLTLWDAARDCSVGRGDPSTAV